MRRTVLFAVAFQVMLSGVSSAQLPDVPAAGAPAGLPTPTPAVAAGAAAPKTGLFGRVRKTPEQRALHRIRFGQSPLGQLVNGLLKPLDALTGGIVGPVGDKDAVNPANLKQPPESALGAAERVKAEAAAAGPKIAAIEELAKADCKRYPEAEAALLASLRAEKIECVRLAAAKALLRGCCCTPKVIKTLTLVVNGSDKDGNLAEDSERVRLTAFAALERCLRVCQPPQPAEEPPEKPKPPPDGEKDVVAQAGWTDMKPADIFAEARKVLAAGITVSPEAIRKTTEPHNLKDMMFGPSVAQPVVTTAPSTRPDRGLVEIVGDAIGRK